MAQQIINIGQAPNDGTGDQLRTAFDKTNQNFNEIYAAGPVGSNIQIAQNNILSTAGPIDFLPAGVTGSILNLNGTNNTVTIDTLAVSNTTTLVGDTTAGVINATDLTTNTLTTNGTLNAIADVVTEGTLSNTFVSDLNDVNINATLSVNGVSTFTDIVIGDEANTVLGTANIYGTVNVTGSNPWITMDGSTGQIFCNDPDGVSGNGVVTVNYLNNNAPGVSTFTGLTDTPADYTTANVGDIVTVNATTDGLEFTTPSTSGPSAITPAVNGSSIVIDGNTDTAPVLLLEESKPVVYIDVQSGANVNLTLQFDTSLDPLQTGNTGLTEFDIMMVHLLGGASAMLSLSFTDVGAGTPTLYDPHNFASNVDQISVWKLRSLGNNEWIIYNVHTSTNV